MKDNSVAYTKFIRQIIFFIKNSVFLVQFFNNFIFIINKSKHLSKVYKYFLFKLLILYRGKNYMSNNMPNIMLDSATKFHDFIYIYGWFYSNERLESIKVIGENNLRYKVLCNLTHNGVINLGIDLGFSISILCDNLVYPDELSLEFSYGKNKVIHSVRDLIASRLGNYDMSAKREFDNFLSENMDLKILDIGGRDRSKVDRSKFYGSDHEITVLDIADGENVDVVGDAHELSSYFSPDVFDVLVSTSVFEHLHSPWKVAIEMNKVLKKGGIALVQTHQTLGMHDMPWDFWRFSDQAWKAIFNSKTGFEILRTNMTHESYILPFLFRRDKIGAEKSAGFELSTVLVRKIGNTIQKWDVSTNEISGQAYPMNIDGFDPENMEMVFK